MRDRHVWFGWSGSAETGDCASRQTRDLHGTDASRGIYGDPHYSQRVHDLAELDYFTKGRGQGTEGLAPVHAASAAFFKSETNAAESRVYHSVVQLFRGHYTRLKHQGTRDTGRVSLVRPGQGEASK